MTVSILVIDDESDVAELYRQCFRSEIRQGMYAMHFANSGEDALGKLAGGVEPTHVREKTRRTTRPDGRRWPGNRRI